MPIACVGISHRTAPIAVREHLALGPEQACAVLAEGSRRARSAGLGELTVLSTCGRTEIYAAATDPAHQFSQAPATLASLLLDDCGIDPILLQPVVYTHLGTAAVRHLCRVSSGLDSMLLGEAEVLGQVASAYTAATESGAAGPILGAAFQTALRAGRRARAETGICRYPLSTATEAVRLIRERCEAGAPVLIIGTGELARLLGRVLRDQGFTHLRFIGRSLERTRVVAGDLSAEALPLHDLPAALRDAAVVLSATAAPHPVLTHEVIAAGLESRVADTPLMLVDLAVPRDVADGVGQLPGILLYDLDALTPRLDRNREARLQEVPRVEAIIDEEIAQFQAWRRGAELRPVLSAMHHRAETIRRREVDRLMAGLAEREPEVFRQVEALSRSLVAHLLHEPSTRLRAEADPVRARTYAGAMRVLFGLDELPEGERVEPGE